MATIGGSDIVRSGLVLNLDAASRRSYPGSGTTWNDVSGLNNNGTLINGPTFSSANGGSIVFDGTNDYVDTVTASSGSATSSYTFSTWFNPATTTSLSLQRGVDGLGNGWSLLAGSDSNLYRVGVVTTLPTVVGSIVSSTFQVMINQWVNVTGVWNAGVSLSLYINGSLNNSSNITGTSLRTSTVGWTLGRLTTTGFTPQLSVASAQVYNRVLSPSEVLQNYNAQKSRFGL
jgi:hypothetical protein